MSLFTATVLLTPFLSLCNAACIPISSTVSHHARSSSTASLNATPGTGIPAGFEPGVKWQIEIQDPVDPRGGLQPSDAKVIDVDLFQASKDLTLIPALHAAGAIVLCYFNAGAVQYTDCDWPKWNSDGLFEGKVVDNYYQEKYVDVTDETVIKLHKARIDLAHSIGCDGLDPDNVDTYELSPDESIGKQITEEDMINFLGNLSSYAHSKTTTLGYSLMIGQKNAVEITDRIHDFMDFAISENCIGTPNSGSNHGADDEFCTTFQQYYVDNGKPVFDIEYPASLASNDKRRRDSSDNSASQEGCSARASKSDVETYCATSSGNNTGISRVLKLDDDDYGLDGCTQYCSEGSAFVMPTYESNSTNSCCFGPDCS
ncbi:hypothetical protein VM1G_07610 [Cytospora mali]|uniref:alpha-galactosidase n=1 Tax=Cytospora mali TaxID=578113 RepID=A0A194W7G5_CYTMA|nr:hypothetical protein VM1G_07610 [Valsa mali]